MIREIGKDAAAHFRAQAEECRRRERESFERCDTDGFLSQWASGIQARLLERCAQIAEQGGLSTFDGLYEIASGRRVAAKIIDTQFGSSWLLRDDEAEKFGRKFIPLGATSRIQKKLGLAERLEKAPAWACISGGGKGLSGCASAFVTHFRVGDKWGQDATPLPEESAGRGEPNCEHGFIGACSECDGCGQTPEPEESAQ